MKTLFLPMACLITLLLTSCQKTSDGPELRRETEQKIIGKWMMERVVNEVYDLLSNTLSSSVEYTGTVDDYYDFMNIARVKIGSAANGQSEVGFTVINPFQVSIGNDIWWIDELTPAKFQFVKDRNDGVQNKRFVTRIYLVK